MTQPLQLDLYKARRRRDRGISRVSGKNMEIIETLRSVAVSLIKLKGQVTMDDLRAWYSASGGREPTHPNAFGAVFKDPKFKRIAFTPSKQVQGHGRIIGVWGLA